MSQQGNPKPRGWGLLLGFRVGWDVGLWHDKRFCKASQGLHSFNKVLSERVLYNFYQSLERRHPAISNESINTVILLKSGGKSWTS